MAEINLPGFTKPTVGRVVHYYDSSLDVSANNYGGKGPYAAIVIQTFETGPYVNLKVFIPFGADIYAGSVSEGDPETAEGRVWCWPPRA